MNVALFDYGAGNLHSLGKAAEASRATVHITDSWNDALAMDALILPGVGSFGAAVGAIEGHAASIRDALGGGLPCLGICLGMQLLFETSEEARGTGIGMIGGSVDRLEAEVVPQMGWNDVETGADPLFDGSGDLVAYYANSFVCRPTDPSVEIAWSVYEGRRYCAGVRRANTWGVQFHPEKSTRDGVRLIRNFVRLAEAVR